VQAGQGPGLKVWHHADDGRGVGVGGGVDGLGPPSARGPLPQCEPAKPFVVWRSHIIVKL
jgi:hypothetical protein